MLHLAVFLCCLAGFIALALAMDRPQETVFGQTLSHPTITALRAVGSGLLVLALGGLASWQGWGLGLVIFSGHTSLAAGVVFCTLIVLERRRG